MVRGGEDILITDRGEVIAELRQSGQEALTETPYSQLVQYAREGKARLGLKNRLDLYSPVTKVLSKRAITKLLDDERGELR
jgi:antitoxin (DNA-binding transcriptional repressor) of toxin-antitoxin stability system